MVTSNLVRLVIKCVVSVHIHVYMYMYLYVHCTCIHSCMPVRERAGGEIKANVHYTEHLYMYIVSADVKNVYTLYTCTSIYMYIHDLRFDH